MIARAFWNRASLSTLCMKPSRLKDITISGLTVLTSEVALYLEIQLIGALAIHLMATIGPSMQAWKLFYLPAM